MYLASAQRAGIVVIVVWSLLAHLRPKSNIFQDRD